MTPVLDGAARGDHASPAAPADHTCSQGKMYRANPRNPQGKTPSATSNDARPYRGMASLPCVPRPSRPCLPSASRPRRTSPGSSRPGAKAALPFRAPRQERRKHPSPARREEAFVRRIASRCGTVTRSCAESHPANGVFHVEQSGRWHALPRTMPHLNSQDSAARPGRHRHTKAGLSDVAEDEVGTPGLQTALSSACRRALPAALRPQPSRLVPRPQRPRLLSALSALSALYLPPRSPRSPR